MKIPDLPPGFTRHIAGIQVPPEFKEGTRIDVQFHDGRVLHNQLADHIGFGACKSNRGAEVTAWRLSENDKVSTLPDEFIRHNPGDPMPVASGVPVDLCFQSGSTCLNVLSLPDHFKELIPAYADREVVGWRHHRPAPAPNVTVSSLLTEAAQTVDQRGKDYDPAKGQERSMARIVEAFNTVTGADLTEAQGWYFMELVKAVRFFTNEATPHRDSLIDGIAYAGLRAEAVLK